MSTEKIDTVDILIWMAQQIFTGDRSTCWDWPFNLHISKRAMVGRTKASHIALKMDGRPRPEAPVNQALHTCDNPSCTNPNHLWWGTQEENMADMASKGRRKNVGGKKGSNHNMALITEEDVKTIRNVYRRGTRNQYELALDYGTTQSNISAIVTNKTWSHVK